MRAKRASAFLILMSGTPASPIIQSCGALSVPRTIPLASYPRLFPAFRRGPLPLPAFAVQLPSQ
jgi:hypothetical protein